MSSTLLTRLKSAWRQRQKRALRLALAGTLLALFSAVAHVARQGTDGARLLAASMLGGALLLAVVGWLYSSRHWRSERSVLRRILFPINPELGSKAVRAFDVVEQTQLDQSLGSPVLAKHHYEKLLKQASLAAVNQAASRRASRWRWFGFCALGLSLAAVIPDPIRLVEGFNVLLAHRNESPLELTFIDLKHVTVKPPSYLRQPLRTAMPGVSGRVAAGSTVVVQGKPRYEGRDLVLTDGVSEVPFVSDGHGGVTANWTLKESAELRVASRYGDVRIQEPEGLPLHAIADQAPRVWLEGAPKTLRLKDIEQVDLRYRALDDHGIRQVDLVIASGDRETRRVLLKLSGEDKSAGGGYSLGGDDELLKRMFLPVHINVEAKDDDPIGGPKWGKSQSIVVLPPTVGEPEARRYTALTEARDRLVDVLAHFAQPTPEDPSELGKHLEERRKKRKAAFEHFEEALEGSYAGLQVPQGMKSFLMGQLKVLKRPPRPGVPQQRQLEDAVLAVDVALRRLAVREAQTVALLLADVVDDVAAGAEQARNSEGRDKGLRRLDHSLKLALEGAAELSKLGALGADLGSVAEGDLGRVSRARSKDDLSHAELAARHLAARLRRPNPSFGSASRGGVESGSAGRGMPQGEASRSDQQFDQLAQELEQLAREHARGVVGVEEALQRASEAVDNSKLQQEAMERAHAIRQSVAGLPEVGAEPGSARASAALAREHARATAQNLERLDLAQAVQSAEQALSALKDAERKANAGSLSDWLDPEELKGASERIQQELSWARQELDKLRSQAAHKASEGLRKASELERELAKRAGNLAGRGKNDQTPLPEDVLKRLDRAELLMRQAAEELAAGSAEKGLDLQRDAQRLLEQSRTGKTSDSGGGSRRAEGSDEGGQEIRLGGEVPDPQDENKAAEFRKRVLRGLGKEREGRLAPAVQRYAEELLR